MPISSLPHLVFFSVLVITCTRTLTPVHGKCLDDQKTWLLKLKSELIFNSSLSLKLVDWNNQTHDWCSWKGVVCDGAGHVTSLQLNDEAISSGIEVSSSLFGLRYLEMLDLSGAGFIGRIPPTIGNLTNLMYLDLSRNFFTGLVPSFHMCMKLITIDLGYNSLSGSISFLLLGLPSLGVLRLSNNQFSGKIDQYSVANFSHMFVLDLSYNSLSGSVSPFLFGLPSIESLDLSNNQFSGKVDEFLIVNQSNLFELDLSYNRLEGKIPHSFFQLHSLQTLLLSNNLFNGTFVMKRIQSLPHLEYLYLSYNNLSIDVTEMGSSSYRFPQLSSLLLDSSILHEFPANSSAFAKLDILSLASCNLYNIPHFIKESAQTLRYLDLSSNWIAGEIPSWIWEIGNGTPFTSLNLSCNLFVDLEKPYHIPASLWTLDLHSNMLGGELPLFPSGYLDCSDNNFNKSIPPDFGNFLRRYLSLANNNLNGEIPLSLCNATYLLVLDLSFNHLTGDIPHCLLGNMSELGVLNLESNNISGVIPDRFPANCSLQTLDLSNNIFRGRIPNSLGYCKQLQVMNVGNNRFEDSFPCMLPQSLRLLVLRSNGFHGEIRCHESWPSLQIIDIASNNFSGSLHLVNFSSWRAMIQESDDAELKQSHLGFTRFNYLPTYYLDEVTLIIKGYGLKLTKIREDFTAIDFSCNNFHGEIPDAIGDLRSLYLLNISHNSLTGKITKSLGNLTLLGSLDLSMNQLTGTIPEELARLTFLSVLNLSYNRLVGVIPNGRQFQTFSADFFKGNLGLCGFPLNISCSNAEDDDDLSSQEDEDVQSKKEIEWEYVFVSLGFVVGLGSIVWLLVFYRSFREKYFDKIDEVVEEIFDGKNRKRRVIRNQGRKQ